MKSFRLRTAFLTCVLGITGVYFFNYEYRKWNESSIQLPQVISNTSIITKICISHLPLESNNTDNFETYAPNVSKNGSGCGNRTGKDSMCDSIPHAILVKD